MCKPSIIDLGFGMTHVSQKNAKQQTSGGSSFFHVLSVFLDRGYVARRAGGRLPAVGLGFPELRSAVTRPVAEGFPRNGFLGWASF